MHGTKFYQDLNIIDHTNISIPINSHKNPGNHGDWSFNWLKLPMLSTYDIKIIQNFQILTGTF